MAAIKHTELFDFPAYEQAIRDVDKSTQDFIGATSTLLKNLTKDQKALTDELKSYIAQLQALNVQQQSAGTILGTVNDQINKATKGYTELQAVQKGLAQVTNLATASNEELRAQYNGLKAQLDKLKPTQSNYNDEVGRLNKQIAEVLPYLNRYKDNLDAVSKSVKVQDGTLAAYRAELAALQKQLINTPNAFDKVTGAINKNNPAAVALSKEIEVLSKSVNAAEQSMGTFTRNVGNYSSAFGKLYGYIRTAANILPGLGISGIFLLIFEGLGKLAEGIGLFGEKVLDAKAAQQKLNDELEKGNTEYTGAVSKIDKLTIQIDEAKKGFLDKNAVLNVYNETLGKSLGHVDNLDDAEKKLIGFGPAYIAMVFQQSLANLALEKSSKAALDAEVKRREDAKKFLTGGDKFTAFTSGQVSAPGYVPGLQDQATRIQTNYIKEQSEKRKAAAIKASEDETKLYKDIAKQASDKAVEIAKQYHIDPLGDDKSTESAERKAEAAAAKALAALKKNVADKQKILKDDLDDQVRQEEIALAQKQVNEDQFQAFKLSKTLEYAGKAIEEEKRLGKNADQDKIRDFQALTDQLLVEQAKRDAKLDAQIQAGAKPFTKTVALTQPKIGYGRSQIGDEQDRIRKEQLQKDIDAENLRFAKIGELRNISFEDEQKHLEAIHDIHAKYGESTAREDIEREKNTAELRKALAEKTEQFIFDAAHTAIESAQASEDARFDAAINNLEKQRQAELDAAGNNDAAKKKIDEAYNKRILDEKRKQAKSDKTFALFNIFLNTAQGVMKTIATLGFPAAIPFIALDVAAGAVQAAAVASKPLPSYRRGTMNASKGLAQVNEEGPELIKKGDKYRIAPGNYTVLEGGEKIYRAQTTKLLIDRFIKEDEVVRQRQITLLHDRVANNLRVGSRENRIREYAAAMQQHSVSRDELRKIMKDTVGDIPIHESHWNERGYYEAERNRNSRVEFMNNKQRRK